MNRIDNNLPKHSGICAKHFKEEFIKIGDRMTLRWDLDPVPTIYNSEFIESVAPSVLPTLTTSRKPLSRVHCKKNMGNFTQKLRVS